jgi:uncharacterized peroxidase-related enzyme
LHPREQAMLEYAMKLTLTPGQMCEADIEALRAAGFSDTGIHDIAQVTALFNLYNRLADGLGIPIDEFAHPGPHPK